MCADSRAARCRQRGLVSLVGSLFVVLGSATGLRPRFELRLCRFVEASAPFLPRNVCAKRLRGDLGIEFHRRYHHACVRGSQGVASGFEMERKSGDGRVHQLSSVDASNRPAGHLDRPFSVSIRRMAPMHLPGRGRGSRVHAWGRDARGARMLRSVSRLVVKPPLRRRPWLAADRGRRAVRRSSVLLRAHIVPRAVCLRMQR